MIEEVHGGPGRYEARAAMVEDTKPGVTRAAQCRYGQGPAACSCEQAWALATAVAYGSALVEQLNEIEQGFMSKLNGVAGVELARTSAEGCSRVRLIWMRYALELQSAS
jgi:hypothetical protein